MEYPSDDDLDAVENTDSACTIQNVGIVDTGSSTGESGQMNEATGAAMGDADDVGSILKPSVHLEPTVHLKTYDRNVRIERPVENVKTNTETSQSRRSKRISVPVKRYNCGVVVCCVCKKKFRDDVSIEYYTDGSVCSVECLKRAQ